MILFDPIFDVTNAIKADPTLASVIAAMVVLLSFLVRHIIRVHGNIEKNQKDITENFVKIYKDQSDEMKHIVTKNNEVMSTMVVSLDLHTKAIERQVEVTEKLKDYITQNVVDAILDRPKKRSRKNLK